MQLWNEVVLPPTWRPGNAAFDEVRFPAWPRLSWPEYRWWILVRLMCLLCTTIVLIGRFSGLSVAVCPHRTVL